ncbi:MAG: hypothetical protein R2761_16355 [Acidimicrobiales bacterium]
MSFAAMARKLDRLLAEHPIRLVHPIAVETWLVKPGSRPAAHPAATISTPCSTS